MDLTPEIKAKIDAMSLIEMIAANRFTPIGDKLMTDESGRYFQERLSELRQSHTNEQWVAASKAVGW